MNDTSEFTDEPVEGFDISDLLLTRTDDSGVILSGNTSFQRVSGYDWVDLIGSEYKLLRHPEMPRSALFFMWQILKAQRACGIYIKNRARCGRFYWVYAVLVPIKDGVLSVRMKPMSPCKDTIIDLYSSVLEAEHEGISLEDGAKMIDQAILDMGFRDYGAFMGYALSAEIAARYDAMGIEVDPSVAKFEEMGAQLVELSTEVKLVKDLFDGISSSPINLNILGSRLSTGREAMQVVAQNYEFLAMELLGAINALAKNMESLLDTAFEGRMGYCSSVLYREAIDGFARNEPNRETRGHAKELVILEAALNAFRKTADDGCDQIAHEVERILTLTTRLRKMLSGLAVARVVCRIEAAAVHEDTSSIDEITERLTVFQDKVGVSLDHIGEICASLSRRMPRAERRFAKRASAA